MKSAVARLKRYDKQQPMLRSRLGEPPTAALLFFVGRGGSPRVLFLVERFIFRLGGYEAIGYGRPTSRGDDGQL